MTVSERRRHDLDAKAEEVLGAESAATMMELLAPRAFSDRATKASTKADLHEALHRQTWTFVTWLLASQSALLALVGVAIVRAG